MTSFQQIPLGKLYSIPSRNGVYKPKNFHGHGYPIVNMGELFEFPFIGNQRMNRISLNEKEIGLNNLKDGDLLFGRRSLIESGAGKCSLVISPDEPTTFESSLIRIRVNRTKVNPRYLYYYFLSSSGRSKIRAIVSGTNVKGIRGSDLEKIIVTIPDVNSQNAIVNLIKSYDDLVENNEGRMKILEEMTQRLYTEWFIKFKFPGHEKVKMVTSNSEFGLIPEGWEIKTLGDICTVGRGSSPRPITDEKYFSEGKIPWLKIADATKSGLFILETKEHVNEYGASFSRLIPKNSLVIATSGTLGFTKFLGIDCCIHDGWMYITGNKIVSNEYLYFVINGYNDYFNSVSYGAAIKNINTELLRNIKVLVPNSQILEIFQNLVSNINCEILNLLQKNINLFKIRDLLMPQLVTGKRELKS